MHQQHLLLLMVTVLTLALVLMQMLTLALKSTQAPDLILVQAVTHLVPIVVSIAHIRSYTIHCSEPLAVVLENKLDVR